MDYKEKFQNYDKDKLIKIVLSSDDYQPEAVIAVKQIIKEKGWNNDLEMNIENARILKEKNQELYEQEIKEKAEYYKNALEFKNQKNSFQIRLADIPKFEGALIEKNISFFREDKNIGVQLENYPTQSYFFKNEDLEEVDKLTKDLSLITVPYLDHKPFLRFEIKVLLIFLAIIIILILILRK